MNARRFLDWARPLLRGKGGARELFLSLPARWEDAGGAGHFLETSAGSERGLDRVKLALILETPPERLAASRRRDAPSKATAALAALRGFNALGSRYDDAAAAAALDVLRAWKLRGSLMLSCDFESAQGVPGKFSIYAYLGPGGLARVAEAVGVEPCGRLPVAVAFWALDLWPDGRFALKFYEKAPYAPASVPSALRTQAGRLHLLAPIRDVTRLTRIGSAANGADKVYVGFQDGLELADLSRAGIFPRHADLINDLRDRAPEQKTYFIGFSGSELELYFDRRDMPSHAYSPATNGRLDPGRHISTRQEARR